MLPDFFAYIGGVEKLCKIQEKIRPEFTEFHFDLPVKHSAESQEGYFSMKDIENVARLNATLSLGFF